MRIRVTVRVGKKVERIEKRARSGAMPEFIVLTTARPERGKANAAVVRALAEYFSVSPSCVRIIQGHTSHTKVVDILR